MRIIAGELGGLQFNAPGGQRTHPMSEKVRGALFNTLGDIQGMTVLDAFAGSGALCFESISRGARSALAIEVDRRAQTTLAQNIKALHLKRNIKLISASAAAWLTTTSERFNLVFIDPPYDDVPLSLIKQLASRASTNGLIIYSLPPDLSLDMPDDCELLHSKNYGDASLHFYKRTAS